MNQKITSSPSPKPLDDPLIRVLATSIRHAEDSGGAGDLAWGCGCGLRAVFMHLHPSLPPTQHQRFLATFGAFMAVRIAIANFVHISGAGIPVFHRSALEPSAIFHCNINFPAANGGHSPYPRAQQRIQDPATQRRRTSPLPCPFRHGVLGAELENWQYGKAGCTRMRAKAGLHTHLLVLHR